MSSDRIVAAALLTRADVRLLGPAFHRLWPVENAPGFEELLEAIDSADCAIRKGRDSHLSPEIHGEDSRSKS